MSNRFTFGRGKGQEQQQGALFQPCITTSETQEQVAVASSLWQHGSISSYRMINVLNAADKRLVARRVTRFITVKLGWGTDIFRLKMLRSVILTWLITPRLCLLLVGNETLKISSPESGNCYLKRNIKQSDNLLQTQTVVCALCTGSIYVLTCSKYCNITKLFLTDT